MFNPSPSFVTMIWRSALLPRLWAEGFGEEGAVPRFEEAFETALGLGHPQRLTVPTVGTVGYARQAPH